MLTIPEKIFKIFTDQAIKTGYRMALEDWGHAPRFISQNKAEKKYGKGNVIKWIRCGYVQKLKDMDGSRNSRVRLEVKELENAAFRCNVIDKLPPRDLAELDETNFNK